MKFVTIWFSNSNIGGNDDDDDYYANMEIDWLNCDKKAINRGFNEPTIWIFRSIYSQTGCFDSIWTVHHLDWLATLNVRSQVDLIQTRFQENTYRFKKRSKSNTAFA